MKTTETCASWKRTFPRISLRSRRERTSVAWLLLALVSFIAFWRLGSQSSLVSTTPWSTVTSFCPALLRISSYIQRWETPVDSSGPCTSAELNTPEKVQCLQHLTSVWKVHGPERIVFVGDERIRYLYERVRYRLGLPILKRPYNIQPRATGFSGRMDMQTAPAHYWEVFQRTLHDTNSVTKMEKNMTFASYRSGNDRLHLEFWWRPYPTRFFAAKLQDLVDDCSTRQARCPITLVLGSGLWTARRFQLTEGVRSADWLSRYRNGLKEALPALRQLATVTQVIWKLEEPVFQQEVYNKKPGIVMSSMTVIQSMVYTILSKVRKVHIWSSMLAETIRFYRKECGTKNITNSLLGKIFSSRHCQNKYYVPVPLLDSYVKRMLLFLCRVRGTIDGTRACCERYWKSETDLTVSLPQSSIHG